MAMRVDGVLGIGICRADRVRIKTEREDNRKQRERKRLYEKNPLSKLSIINFFVGRARREREWIKRERFYRISNINYTGV
jgi:hypothetical protein